MEDYRNKVSNYMQLYPRILVNVLVISVNVLVNLLKLAKTGQRFLTTCEFNLADSLADFFLPA